MYATLHKSTRSDEPPRGILFELLRVGDITLWVNFVKGGKAYRELENARKKLLYKSGYTPLIQIISEMLCITYAQNPTYHKALSMLEFNSEEKTKSMMAADGALAD